MASIRPIGTQIPVWNCLFLPYSTSKVNISSPLKLLRIRLAPLLSPGATAKSHFDNLYLVVDQQYRWKSKLLPDPRPRILDPILIGERKQGRGRKFYVIYQFDLTEAEQYLADEFATKPDGAFACPPTAGPC